MKFHAIAISSLVRAYLSRFFKTRSTEIRAESQFRRELERAFSQSSLEFLIYTPPVITRYFVLRSLSFERRSAIYPTGIFLSREILPSISFVYLCSYFLLLSRAISRHHLSVLSSLFPREAFPFPRLCTVKLYGVSCGFTNNTPNIRVSELCHVRLHAP